MANAAGVAGIVAGGRWLGRQRLDGLLARLAVSSVSIPSLSEIADSLDRDHPESALQSFARLEPRNRELGKLIEEWINGQRIFAPGKGDVSEGFICFG